MTFNLYFSPGARKYFQQWFADMKPSDTIGFLVSIGGDKGKDRIAIQEYLEEWLIMIIRGEAKSPVDPYPDRFNPQAFVRYGIIGVDHAAIVKIIWNGKET